MKVNTKERRSRGNLFMLKLITGVAIFEFIIIIVICGYYYNNFNKKIDVITNHLIETKEIVSDIDSPIIIETIVEEKVEEEEVEEEVDYLSIYPVSGEIISTVLLYSEKYNIPDEIVFAIMEQESTFDINADNPGSSASGLMQIIESTGEYIHKLMGNTDVYNHEDIYDMSMNIEYAVFYMRYLLNNSDGDIRTMLMNYRGVLDEPVVAESYLNDLDKHLANRRDTSISQLQSEIDL